MATPAAVARRFRNQPIATRAYIALRHRVLPADLLESLLPRAGHVVDLCCGYGTLAMLAALRSPERRVTAVDLDEKRVAIASFVAADIGNLRFEQGDIRSFHPRDADAVLLIDSLHYFPPPEQLAILRSVRRGVAAGGVLICREVVRSRSLRFFWNWLHERLMVGLSITRAKQRTLFFHSLSELTQQFGDAGFEVNRVVGPPRWHPYADHILVARAV